jgi:PAS domain S-box-containing protein
MSVRSLPFKINTAIITTAVVISTLFIISLYPLELNRRENQIKRIHLLLDTVFKQKINDLANELFAKQERALAATVKEVGAVDGIVGVSIYDDTGRLFLSSNHQLNTPVAQEIIRRIEKEPLFESLRKGGRSLGVYANIIEVIGKKIGYIVLCYDLAKIESESNKALSIFFFLLVAMILLMAVILNLFLFRSVIRPVSMLRNAMRRVEEGNLGETVTLTGKDEIGDMGSAFNDMSLKLRNGSEALIEAEKKYRGIFENAIEGIFQYSPQQEHFITVNPSMAAILGYSSPEQLMAAIDDVGEQLFAREADRINYDQALHRTGQIIDLTAELYTQTGSIIWVAMSARRVTDEGGAILYDEGTLVDITERRQRERAERRRETAETANRAKSEFLAKMSHEIRTPLNVILGFAEILGSSLTDSTHREHLQVIKSSGASLLHLIKDILDLSKIEAGHMDIKPSAVNIRTLTAELLTVFSMNAKQKRIDLKAVVALDVPEYLMLDRARLRQILFNLIGNAIKFTDKGFVEIHVNAQKGVGRNRWDLSIEVRDSGPGIEVEAQQLIFESFRQHHSGQSAAVEGAGLGLAISKNLVEMMNGRIVVDSKPEMGSVFTVMLAEVVAAGQAAADSESDTHPGAGDIALVFRPASLLVVDDLTVNRQLVSVALSDSPLRILETDNGQSAVSMAGQHSPDIILMDIKMPGMDGYEAIRLIRQDHQLTMPIIATTAAGMKEDILKIITAGFDDYLIRPFNKRQLQQKLARFLKHEIKPSYIDVESAGLTVPGSDQNSAPYWDCPLEVADLLRGRYKQAWEKICQKQRIPDIKMFSNEIREMGERYELDVLTQYGRNLAMYADAINIDKLQRSMADFPGLLSSMRPLAPDVACCKRK